MKVDIRSPRLEVRVTTRRTGPIDHELLRKSIVEVSTHRNIGDSCGSFNITLTPNNGIPFRRDVSKWRDMIEPNDYVEIFMWVPPRTLPVPVMRGLVDSVTESQSLRGNTPERHVSITGRDFGKIALISKLYFMEKKVLPQNFTIMQKWIDGFRQLTSLGRVTKQPASRLDSPDPLGEGYLSIDPDDTQPGQNPPPPNLVVHPCDVMEVIFNAFYKPQLEEWKKLLKVNPNVRIDDVLARQEPWEKRLVALTPEYSPHTWNPLTELWDLFRQFQHGPWRELFFEEDATGPVLKYRPTPWLDIDGRPVQPVPEFEDFQVVDINTDNVVEGQLLRSDEAVVNLFVTLPWMADSYIALYRSYGPLEGIFDTPKFKSNPWLVGLDDADAPSSYQMHGVRVMERRTPYITLDRTAPERDMLAAFKDLRTLGTEANTRLKRAFDHGELLEHGAVTIKGDERIRLGTYVDFDKSGYLAYVEGVGHRFRQGTDSSGGSFTTSLRLTRGRGHLKRAGYPAPATEYL